MTFNLQNTLATCTALLILSGCASQGTKPVALQDAMNKQTQLQQDQRIASNAGIELNELGQYIDRANRAWQEGEEEELQQQLYLANRQSAVTESTGLAEHYRDQIESMSEKRQQLLIQAKNAELERTRSRLETTESELQTKASELQTKTSALTQTQQELLAKSEELQKLDQIAQSAEQQAIALANELTSVKAEMTQRGMVLTLQDILFEFNKAELKSGANRAINKVAEFLNNNQKVRVTIEGFTDSVGSEQYNLQLSQKRADSVKQALVQQNVETDRMQTKALGEGFPVATNATPEGRQENRRVELVLNEPKQ